MLDIPSLEQRWLKYKIKRSLPYLLTVVGTIIVVITLYYFLNPDKESIPLTIKKEVNQSKEEPKTSVHDEAMVLEPSMQFIQSITTVTAPDITAPEVNTPATPLLVTPKKHYPYKKLFHHRCLLSKIFKILSRHLPCQN